MSSDNYNREKITPSKVAKVALLKTTKYTNKMNKSNITIFVIIGLFSLFLILQSLGYHSGQLAITSGNKLLYSKNALNTLSSTTNAAGASYAWKGWVSIAVSSIGGACAIISVVYINRMKKRFVIFEGTCNVMFLINALLVKYWFFAINQVILIILTFIMYISWIKKEGEDDLKPKKNNWYLVALIFSLVVLVGFVLGYGMSFAGGGWEDPHPYLDGVAFVLGVYGYYYWIVVSIVSAYIYIIVNTIYMFMFIFTSGWSMVLWTILSTIFDLSTLLIWLEMSNKPESVDKVYKKQFKRIS